MSPTIHPAPSLTIARFYFDPNSIVMGSGDAHFIFYGNNASSVPVVRLEFGFSTGGYQLRAALQWDSTSWQAAMAAGAKDGSVTLWIDGVQQGRRTSVDNDTLRVDNAQLGPVSGLDTGTRRTYHFDAFESRRQTYIGP